jgi:hypothetical protein
MNLGWTFFALALTFCLAFTATAGDNKSERVFEMRTYWAPEGKLDDLNARFRNYTTKLFEKHGITNVGYWMPIDNPERKLIYFISSPSKEAHDKAWKAFGQDPEWQRVKKETEANGKIVAKVESLFLKLTDYSPQPTPSSAGERIFELRTYTTPPDRLAALDARFRDHTMKLFEKHGMTNIVYWTPIAGQKGAGETLIYLLAHKSVEAAKESFAGFRGDPVWQAALKASEEKAGGSLTVKNGVKSLFVKATDYSPIR